MLVFSLIHIIRFNFRDIIKKTKKKRLFLDFIFNWSSIN